MIGLILTHILAYGGALAALFAPLVGLFVYTLFSIIRPHQMFGWAGNVSGVSQVVGIAMLVGWLIQGFGTWQFGRARRAAWLLVAFLVWHTLSTVFAYAPEAAWGETIERGKAVAAFFVGLTLLTDRRWLMGFAWLMVVASGYVAYEMHYAYYIDGYNRAQQFGLLGDNNSFAISQVAAVGPALFLAFGARSWWQKGVAFGCAILMMHTVIMTFSRGGLLALIVTGLVVAVLMPKRPAYLVGLVLAIVLGVRLTGPQVVDRFATTFAAEEERDFSAQSRVDLWRDCLQVTARYPMLGVGPHNFPLIVHEFGWPPGKSPHSLWMQKSAELGIPGILFFFGFFAWGMWAGLSLARQRGDPALAALGMYVFSGLFGFVVAAQFVSIQGLELPYYLVLIGAAAIRQLDASHQLATRVASTAAAGGPVPATW